MIRASRVLPRGGWPAGASAADAVVLDFDERHRRRIAMVGTGGLGFLLDLPEAVALRGGDALVLDDGRLVEVVAAPEPLVEARDPAPGALARLAWHVGNRHLPAQITATALRLRRDAVIEDMLRGLGASLRAIEAPFDPEGGAYANADRAAPEHERGGKHGHGHEHEHGHKHGHDHHHHGHGHDHHHGHGHGGKHDP